MKKSIILAGILIAVVLCISYKTIKAQTVNHWEMVVAAGDTWKYFPGTAEPPATWINPEFNTASWASGPGGIGYGDGDDGTSISNVPSVFLRSSFNIIDTSNVSLVILSIDYDDAFVAYLNGQEIARANIGTVGIRPPYNAYSNVDHEARLYQGGVPETFVIPKSVLKNNLFQGTNVLAVQVHNVNSTSSDLSSNTFFMVGVKNAGTSYRPVPAWFKAPFDLRYNLPLLIIDTKGQTILNEPKIAASFKIIDNGPGQLNGLLDEPTGYNGNIGIEIRGQSSQQFPKKGYGIELWTSAGADTSASLLGMPADEDWVLSAPYSDKTMMRNAITYQLGRTMGGWQPRFKYCEVYLNGSYNGVYMLIEKIKRGADRVDINKLKPDEISGDNLTGGYILKVDKIGDITSAEYFYSYPSVTFSNTRSYAFTYVYPKYDEIVVQQKSYIQNYMVSLQNALNGTSFKDPVNGFRKFMDVNSFVDFQIVNELANNVDGYRYSTFFYKKKDSDGGKLFAGPLWDFDLCYGNVDYDNQNLATNNWLYERYGPGEWQPMHWWARLMQDEEYRQTYAKRWKALRQGAFSTDSIMAGLDKNIQVMGDAIARNYERWPILGVYVWPNYFVGNTYQSEVDYMKTWITNRLNWMDGNVSLSVGNSVAAGKDYDVFVYPNPVSDQVNIRLKTKSISRIECEIVDLPGKLVCRFEYLPVSSGEQDIQFAMPGVAPGYYFLRLLQDRKMIGMQQLVKSN